MLRIIHRVKDGQVSERLVSLDGSGREFIRTGSELACYLPDQRTVRDREAPRAAVRCSATSRRSTRPPPPSTTSSRSAHAHLSARRARDLGDAERRVPLRLPAVDRRRHGDAAAHAALRRARPAHRAARPRGRPGAADQRGHPWTRPSSRRCRPKGSGFCARPDPAHRPHGRGRPRVDRWMPRSCRLGLRITLRAFQAMPGARGRSGT